MAGSLAYSIDGSVQFRILLLSESKNCDSLKVQLPQEKVKDADGPAQCIDRLVSGELICELAVGWVPACSWVRYH